MLVLWLLSVDFLCYSCQLRVATDASTLSGVVDHPVCSQESFLCVAGRLRGTVNLIDYICIPQL